MGRFYPVEGRNLPSVTTILKATEDQATLHLWYANKKNALLKNAIAQDRGNQLHAWASAYAQDKPLPPYDPKFNRWLNRLKPVLDEVKSGSEVVCDRVVYDLARGRGYAGTFDIWADGVLYELKMKDSKVFPQALNQALVQGVAYAEAADLCVEQVCVVAVTPYNLEQHCVERGGSLWSELAQVWQERLDFYATL